MPRLASPNPISRVPFARRVAPWAALGVAALWLAGCGGGQDAPAAAESAEAAPASATSAWELDPQAVAADTAALSVRPTFHLAPVVLQPPSDVDAQAPDRSATLPPKSQAVPSEFRGLSTRGLTPGVLEDVRTKGAAYAPAQDGPGAVATPLAGGVVTTYTVAQVRAAYGFSALPAVGTKPVGLDAARLGAGQTVYLVAARHNPNVAAELAAFNQKFGLPACTTKVVPAATALPLPAASAAAGCELWVAYSTAAGGLSSVAPAYDAGWATEIALDVQWSHAIAPLARIVLVEAPDPSVNSLLAAVRLANSMGPGVVSMSFGAQEGSWTGSVDSAFAGAGMSYFAATGDWGAGVMWPSVSPGVVAVGGTTLTYSGVGARSEVAWSGTGGGISAYTATPAYQKSGLPGVGSAPRRTVADVAMNADPSTGHYLAVMPAGTAAVQWMSAGGTSLSSPMWAGLAAVANATRVLASKPALGNGANTLLYGQIGAVPSAYASAFADVTLGSHGTCSTCSARTGYDELTGLGTPQAGTLVSLLSGAAAPAVAPVVAPATVAGKVGTALTFTASVQAANPVAFSLAGAPSGMSIASTGVVSWPAPVAGTFAVTVVARDTVTGLTGQGVYTVAVAAPVAPVVTGAAISGRPGVALAFKPTITAPNPVTCTLAGAPAGMVVGSDCTVSWPKPVAGTFNVTLTAKDGKTGLSGSGVLSVKIATAGPVITAAAMVGVAGQPLTGTISVSSPGATSLNVTIAGAPLGMGFSVAGTTITAKWPSPVAGNYQMTVSARDSAGLTAQVVVPITVTAK